MKYNFLILLLIASLWSCKSGFNISQEENDVDYQIINAFISLRKIKALKKETFEPKSNDSIITQLISSNGLNLFHYNLTEDQQNINFEKIFSKNDIGQIKAEFERLRMRRLDKKRLSRDVKIVSTLDKKGETRMITMPIIVPNKNYVFVYSESISDGDLFCMKMENGKWMPFASFPLWTSD
ncbi:hypothetical protein FVB32_04735 [Flagellimonas hymeniacidonis]|uniref:Uncharacterized protein n=1 Tax=Flagellimonas hymeniacidonis TaxID=2603628 RepID=A0A5C8V8W3_9FLAO|nr:hypothetical protein [Flagellimonas hymeniacidonis]TXN37599.1 hypothetical protein FVB32_04735 [Flagellimonas hymeniacidonis]